MKVYASGMTYGEGPRWRAGALWLSDTQGSRLWTDDSGTWGATSLESPSNGLWFLPDGMLVGAMMREKRIGFWTGNHFATYVDLSDIAEGPLGDMVGDASGNLYVDDVGYIHGKEAPRPGRLLRVGRDKSVAIVAEGVEFPNGLALIDGGRTLVMAETWAQRLVAFSVSTDGRLHDRRLYLDLATAIGPDAQPDGLWATSAGIWVATQAAHSVALVSDAGVLASFDCGLDLPIACCVTDDDRLLVTVAETAGLALGEAIAKAALTARVVVFDISDSSSLPSA